MQGDRKGISSTGPSTLNSGGVKSLDLALVFSRGDSGYGNVYPVTMLPSRVSDVRNFYNSQSYGCDETMLAVSTIKSTIAATSILVYPNPSSGIFKMELSGIINEPSVEVYNVLGEKVFSKFPIDNPKFSIDLSNQTSGVYFYRVLTKNVSLVGEGKIIKQ